LIVDKNAYYKTVFPEMTLHFDSNPIIIEKWIIKKPLTAIYYDSVKKIYYLKRFLIENENKVDKVIPENSVLKFITSIARPILEIKFYNSSIKNHDDLIINAEEFITIKGFKAMGNQLTPNKIKSVVVTKKLEYIEDQEIKLDELEVDDLEEIKDDKNQIELDF
jgi:topoisomerase-4 subunit A